jgi:hypothetical protein
MHPNTTVNPPNPRALRRFVESWFVDLSGDRYVFGRTNINKLIDDYMRVSKRSKLQALWNEIQKEQTHGGLRFAAYRNKPLGNIPCGYRNLHVWVNRSDEVPDTRAPTCIADYTLPLMVQGEHEHSNPDEACDAVRDYIKHGAHIRSYKNTVYFSYSRPKTY